MKLELFTYHDAQCFIPEETTSQIKNLLETSTAVLGKDSARSFRQSILDSLYKGGWNKNPGLSFKSHISITAYKNGIGLCFQTGNVSRIYADLLKLQTLWSSEKITAGIIVLPLLSTSKLIGSNVASFERLKNELGIFSRVITMPLLLIGFNYSGGNNND